jgi:hypothetical protein
MFAWRDNFIGYSDAAPTPTDPYWTSVSFLQNFEQDIPPSAYDLSTNNFQPMVTGVARPSTRTPFSTGGSYKFDGTTASQIIIPQSTGFSFGSGNFTVECWVYITAFPANNLDFVAVATNQTSAGQASTRLVSTNTGAVYFLCNNSTGTGWINTSTTAAGTLTVNNWFHLAGVRNGTNFTLYVNGVSRLSYTSSSVVGYRTDGNTTNIGNLPVGTGFTGANNSWVTNVRVVKGTAVYTAAFTPPTSPLTAISGTELLLTFPNQNQSNFSVPVDSSFNSYPVTNLSVVATTSRCPFSGFVGSFDFTDPSTYLDAATQTLFNYSTLDFTVEGWFQLTQTGVLQYLIDQRNGGTSTSFSPTIYVDSSNKLVYFSNGAARITGLTSLTTGVWYHVAACRASNTTRLFLNGVQQSTNYSDANTYVQTRVTIGSNGATIGNYFGGYASNVRLTRGTALYTTTFTPSTTPLTVSSSTSLFLDGTTLGLYDISSFYEKITTPNFTGSLSSATGGTAATTLVSPVRYKWGTQSVYFQRQSTTIGGFQTVYNTTALTLGTGDFTIELWFYTNSTSAQGIICKGGAASTGWILQLNGSNQLLWISGSTTLKSSTTVLAANTWNYVAITRSGTTGYMFLNGTLEGATYTDNSDYNQTNNMLIGSNRSFQSGFVGYMDDIRITKGVCRYTASFSPPSEAFPTS